jgi:hypothetical protein
MELIKAEKLLTSCINVTAMEGINFVTDDKNEKIAVQIDLRKYGELWEDFYDSVVADLRKDEERVTLGDLIQDLKSKGKLTEDV